MSSYCVGVETFRVQIKPHPDWTLLKSSILIFRRVSPSFSYGSPPPEELVLAILYLLSIAKTPLKDVHVVPVPRCPSAQLHAQFWQLRTRYSAT